MKVQLELDCGDLELGETRRLVCPSCGGGRSGERSLNVTRTDDGALLYLCWRASCDARGAVGGSPVRIAKLAERPNRFVRTKADPSSRFIDFVDTAYRDINLGNWAVDYENLFHFGVKFDPETQRLALPCYNPVGRIRGWVLRLVEGNTGRGPKVLAVPTMPEPQLGWNTGGSGVSPYQNSSKDVIVVEDIPSAIRLRSFNVRAVALNGTHLTDEACEELVAEAENVVFALDRDAFGKSLALEKKLRIHFDKTASLLLPKDFKNQTNEEVLSCLSELSWLAFSNPENLGSE